jgi:heme-degrading monooxygenase HmoA
VIRWRCQRDHHRIQGRGRYELFADYRLRVCEVTTDTGLPAGTTLVQQRFDETEVGDAKALGITELPPTHRTGTHELVPEAEGLTAHDLFESIYNPGKMLLLTSWSTAERAAAWAPGSDPIGLRHRRVRVIRDYGLADRREAPQYYPPVSERLGARPAPPPEP